MPDKLAAKFIFSIKQLFNTDNKTLTVLMHTQRTQFSNLTETKDDRKQGNTLEPWRFSVCFMGSIYSPKINAISYKAAVIIRCQSWTHYQQSWELVTSFNQSQTNHFQDAAEADRAIRKKKWSP